MGAGQDGEEDRRAKVLMYDWHTESEEAIPDLSLCGSG